MAVAGMPSNRRFHRPPTAPAVPTNARAEANWRDVRMGQSAHGGWYLFDRVFPVCKLAQIQKMRFDMYDAPCLAKRLECAVFRRFPAVFRCQNQSAGIRRTPDA